MIRKKTFSGLVQDIPLEFSNHVEGRGAQVISITTQGLSYTIWVRVKGPESNWQSILQDWRHVRRE